MHHHKWENYLEALVLEQPLYLKNLRLFVSQLVVHDVRNILLNYIIDKE